MSFFNQKSKIRLGVLGILFGLFCGTSSLHAAVSALDLGLQVPSYTGNYTQILEGGMRFRLGVNFTPFEKVKSLTPFLAAAYHQANIKNFTTLKMRMIDVVGGVRLSADSGWWVSPFVSVALGGTQIAQVFTPSDGVTQNSKTYFLVEFAPGIEAHVFGPVTIAYELDGKFIFTNPALPIFGHSFVVRVNL